MKIINHHGMMMVSLERFQHERGKAMDTHLEEAYEDRYTILADWDAEYEPEDDEEEDEEEDEEDYDDHVDYVGQHRATVL